MNQFLAQERSWIILSVEEEMAAVTNFDIFGEETLWNVFEGDIKVLLDPLDRDIVCVG